MSMLDAFFSKGFFKATRCKTLLKLTIPRIKLLRNRREMQIKQMRKEIANLLQAGQESTARIRVEHIIREENMMAAQEILELFCELIAVRLPIIEAQRECPLDLKEAISSICFAAPRCADLPELQQVQTQFAGKYGKEFVAAASELLPECGVNRQIIELLSVRAPTVEVKMKLLKEIAIEHDLDWDPDSAEAEFRKPHEDLLNGPGRFIGGSTFPLPGKKFDDSMFSTTYSESETGLDSLDLPEVPKVSPLPNQNIPPAPDSLKPPVIPVSEALPTILTPVSESVKSASDVDSHLHSNLESNVVTPLPLSTSSYALPPSFITVDEQNKQFAPYVSPPPPSQPTVESLNTSAEPSSSISQSKNETMVDLDVVLAAAHAAVENAERAASAAHEAASLVQVRISELVMKTNGRDTTSDIQVSRCNPIETDVVEINEFAQHPSNENSISFFGPDKMYQEPGLPVISHNQVSHQPSRSSSLEDDTYFSYPNLFGRHNSNANQDFGK